MILDDVPFGKHLETESGDCIGSLRDRKPGSIHVRGRYVHDTHESQRLIGYYIWLDYD